jgi:hypothetical protein
MEGIQEFTGWRKAVAGDDPAFVECPYQQECDGKGKDELYNFHRLITVAREMNS